MELRPYQIKLVEDVREQVRSGQKRILIQLPTGGGKTAIASYIISQTVNNGYRAMMTVHRAELATQSAKTMEAFNVPYGMIQSGSKTDLSKPMQVASILTLRNRLKNVPAPTVLVVDECQHLVSRTWKEVADYYSSQGSIILGLSATPKRLSNEPLSSCFDVMVQGPTIQELIDQGALSKYKYFAPSVGIDTTTIKIQRGDYAKHELEIAVNKNKITGNVIEHYKRLIPGKRAIVFCVSIAHAKAVAEQFSRSGIPAEFIEGNMTRDARKSAFERFRSGETLALVNVEIAGEGVDIPAVESVIMLRPTMSEALYLQQAGRGLRPDPDNPGKIAIILDHCNNVARHGLPNAPRIWTLDGATSRRKSTETAVGIRYCPNCFLAHSPAPKCPYCGLVYTVTSRLLAEEAGELEEYDAKNKEFKKTIQRMEVGMCRTLADLMQVASERGYKKSWVFFTAKAKHIKE